jgi:hypothetical protein
MLSRFFHLAGLTLAVALAPSLPAGPGVEAVKASLSLELEVAGGRMRLEADQFHQTGDSQTLVPLHCQIWLSGRQRATSTITGMSGTPEDWVSRYEVTTDLKDEIEAVLHPGSDADWREIVRAAPVRVSLGQGESPLLEIAVDVPPTPPEAGSSGWKLTRTSRSMRAESTVTRERRDGAWIEVAGPGKVYPVTPRIQIDFGAGRDGNRLRHGQLIGPDVVFVDEELRSAKRTASQRVVSQGEASITSHSDPLPGVLGGFGDLPVALKWQFRLGEAPDVGWFEAAAISVGKPWWPEWGGSRDFLIKLSRPDLVQEVNVYLDAVSSVPGVALNAVEAAVVRPEGWTAHHRDVPVDFREGAFAVHWTRTEVEPLAGPVDVGPDLWLSAADGETREGAERLQRLTLSSIKPQMAVRVHPADYAAKGGLGVRVKVDGFWEDLPPKGEGIVSQRPQLSIPIDRDGDGLPDGWATTSYEDGDGLTPAQEYRGGIAGGKHRRLSPLRREVFLTDPQGCLRSEDREAMVRRFAGFRVDLIFLDEGETITNGVPVIWIERLHDHFWPQLMRLDDVAAQKAALRAIRPGPGCGTLFVGDRVDPLLFSGDLARILNLDQLGAQP